MRGALHSPGFSEFIFFGVVQKFGTCIFHSVNVARGERQQEDKIYSIGLKG